jgi:hypothetical protein
MKKLKYFFTSHPNTADNARTTTTHTTMATTTTQGINTSFGLGRMSEDEYQREFNTCEEGGGEVGLTTPRPGTSKTDNAAAARAASRAIWNFSQLAAATAAANKRRTATRTDYRMAANKLIEQGLKQLGARLLVQQRTSAMSATVEEAVMSEADFNVLKRAIEQFSVRIVVHDSLTLEQLKQAQAKCQLELTAILQTKQAQQQSHQAIYQKPDIKEERDLIEWNTTLSTEIRRMTCQKETVPSQHAQISRSSGLTLQNILSPETIRRKFVSLNALTKAIRSDLLVFLTNDSRAKDRAIVVQQIKDSYAAASVAKAAMKKRRAAAVAAATAAIAALSRTV